MVTLVQLHLVSLVAKEVLLLLAGKADLPATAMFLPALAMEHMERTVALVHSPPQAPPAHMVAMVDVEAVALLDTTGDQCMSPIT